ncbi:Calcium/calmodulin-dependent protein kinase type 1 [Blomia tropicalis]|nr:Calcium/calmodulin-dependent protein kinase type 1 [Blomia tropicalis]
MDETKLIDTNNNKPLNGSMDVKNNVETKYKIELVWRNIGLMILLHGLAIVGLYQYLFVAKLSTIIFVNALTILLGFGVTCGAHRLWSHRTYEATLPLRIFLMILNTASLQNDIYEWSRDHRVHHKFSDTDADPHNSTRGFFFAHMGWLFCKKHPHVLDKGKTVALDDIAADPVVAFQRQFYKPLTMIFTFYIPTYIICYYFGEDYYSAFYLSCFRYCFSLHSTWLVNSAAHLYGVKPYDTRINPRESKLVQILTVGEGYHNYHHVFPFDYSASEVSWTQDLNLSTMFIDLCAKLGLAYNLKKVDPKLIQSRVERTGDVTLNQIYLENRGGTFKWTSVLSLVYFLLIIPVGIVLVRKVFV